MESVNGSLNGENGTTGDGITPSVEKKGDVSEDLALMGVCRPINAESVLQMAINGSGSMAAELSDSLEWYAQLSKEERLVIDSGVASIIHGGCVIAARRSYDSLMRQKKPNRDKRRKRKKEKRKKHNQEERSNLASHSYHGYPTYGQPGFHGEHRMHLDRYNDGGGREGYGNGMPSSQWQAGRDLQASGHYDSLTPGRSRSHGHRSNDRSPDHGFSDHYSSHMGRSSAGGRMPEGSRRFMGGTSGPLDLRSRLDQATRHERSHRVDHGSSSGGKPSIEDAVLARGDNGDQLRNASDNATSVGTEMDDDKVLERHSPSRAPVERDSRRRKRSKDGKRSIGDHDRERRSRVHAPRSRQSRMRSPRRGRNGEEKGRSSHRRRSRDKSRRRSHHRRHDSSSSHSTEPDRRRRHRRKRSSEDNNDSSLTPN